MGRGREQEKIVVIWKERVTGIREKVEGKGIGDKGGEKRGKKIQMFRKATSRMYE